LSSEAIDGVLDAARAASYLAHLESCPPCRVFDTELRESIAMLDELPRVDVREGFEEMVWNRIARENAERGGERSMVRWLRERLAALAPETRRGIGWSFATVGAVVFVLSLVSGDPAPESSIARTPRGSEPQLAADAGARLATPAGVQETASSSSVEDEFVAEMPQAVQEYLQNAKDLRLPDSVDRYRRSNYSYPVRRVDDPSLFLTGESASPSGPRAPAASEEATVISF
jgi:anti-sigma factor RsiW